MNTKIRCFRCGSDQVVKGKVLGHKGRRPLFRPEGTKFLKLSFISPFLKVEYESYACLHCGLFWSITDADHAREKVKKWGNPSLKKRLGME